MTVPLTPAPATAAAAGGITVRPVPYAETVGKRLRDEQFGVVVEGIKDINRLTEEEFAIIEKLLYKHGVVVFEDVDLTPAGQHALTNAFDPDAQEYGHGKVGRPDQASKSILHPDLRTIPGTEVQLIGNGLVTDEHVLQGLANPCKLRHPSHQTFHRTRISDDDSAKGFTRFYRWHIDAALYERDPPKVTTLYGLQMPTAKRNTVRYDDGTGDELEVPLGGTAFVSGKVMFDILPAHLKSLAVRTKVRYAPHPYVWMGSARARSTGLGMESEGTEMALDDLPPWKDEHVKTLPVCWKNPVTGHLHFQVHPSAIHELLVDPLPAGASRTPDTLYPDGAHLTDLKEVRELMYSMQRPGIAPELVYVVDWKPKQLALFHNRGTLHSITGAFAEDEVRAFWQCNQAASVPVVGPTEEDVRRCA
ncbi:taurine catabolism dioxygenase [Rhodotorula diobovata]|uniref:Taurine catabolism dioxygenase n=1 Tax=Rhodotorula diobovata TaxID=5288 RepID=A0A5C5G6A4_9BASI|nr:taurine catabolism dioxygenase [Rhodotorula diobovata]